MSREAHVRFWESAGVKFPRATRLPLERQVRMMGREGLSITSQTLWDQIEALDLLVRSVRPRLLAYVLSHDVVGADETRWRLLTGGSKSWYGWLLHVSNTVYYTIKDSRSKEVVDKLREKLGPGNWTMFSTSVVGDPSHTADFFLLPPSAGISLQTGVVVEEVRFARDEMAEMAWAIESVLENEAGAPWPQHEREVARHGGLPQPPFTQDAAIPFRYLIESRVPEYWIPLVPVSLDPSRGRVALEVRAMLDPSSQAPIAPRGRILNPSSVGASQPYQLPEEEVPRNGVRVQRLACRSRWIDGSTHVWQLRRVQPGTGEANSALRFDQPLPTQ